MDRYHNSRKMVEIGDNRTYDLKWKIRYLKIGKEIGKVYFSYFATKKNPYKQKGSDNWCSWYEWIDITRVERWEG